MHRNGRGDGQAGDIESDALASQNKYHSFKALSPTGHGERELPFQLILGQLRGYGCSLLALGPGLMGTTPPFETHRGTHKRPGRGLGVTRDVKDTEDNYTGNREELRV